MKTVDYKSLDIHNRINAKTGWRIAKAYEGKQFGSCKCYTQLSVLLSEGVNPKLVGNVYKCY